MFSRPVISGWKPPAKPSGHDTRTERLILPEFGISVPAISRNKVDFPAPFTPIRP